MDEIKDKAHANVSWLPRVLTIRTPPSTQGTAVHSLRDTGIEHNVSF